MPRKNEIWFRKQTGWWVVKIGGVLHKLANGKQNKDAAEIEFHKLKILQTEHPADPGVRVASLVESFLDWSQKHHAADTYRNHNFYLQSFAEV